MAGIIYYDNGTKWRYENAGIAEGLKVSGTTVTGLDSTKSKTGTAFWQTNRESIFPIPATKELWVKFDLYYGGAQWRVYDRLNGNDTGFGLIDNTTTLVSYINGPLKLVPKPENTITKNQLHTFLLHMVSDSTNGIVELWCDGTKYYTDDYADEGLIYMGNIENGADFENLYLQSQNANCLFSNVIISNAPIGLGENVIGYGLTSSLDFDLKTEITTSVELNCGLERNVKKIFRYENYGTADLLSISGTTVALAKNQSRYYSGFYQPQRIKCFDIPATKEIWIRCDINVVANVSSSRIRIYNDPDAIVFSGWSTYDGSLTKNYIYWVNGTSYDGGYRVSRDDEGAGKQAFLLHMKSGVTDGFLEFYFWSKSNGSYRSFTGNVNNGNDFDNVYIQMDGTNIQVSDLIISNEEISINEHCKVPQTAQFDITRGIANLCEVLFDMERQVSNAALDGGINLDFGLVRDISNRYVIDFDLRRDVGVWRYENYGTADLLSVAGTTVALTKTQSRYYSGFQATAARSNYFGIPATKEVWIKFDLYFSVKYQSLFFGSLDNDKTSQVRLNCCGTGNEYHRIIFALSESVKNNQSNQLYAGALYRVLLHMKSDTTNGKIELFVSDGYNLSYTGNVNNGNDFENVYIQASNYNSISTYPYVSNVIISNAAVDINENCKVPVESQYDIIRSLTYPIEYYYDIVRDVEFGIKVSETFDIVRNVNRLVELFFDTVRALRGTWRYENYGTTDLLLPEVQAETVEVDTEKSLTGFAYKNPYLRARQFEIPATDEIWVKFDFYVTNLENERLFVGNYSVLGDPYSRDFGAALWFYSSRVEIATNGASPTGTSAFTHETVDLNIFQGKLCRALLHMKSDSTNGKIDITISGGYNFSVTGNVNGGEEFDRICITTNGSKQVKDPNEFLISNVIISNSPLQLTDDVVTLPTLREVTVDFDLIRDILGVWRYENEGKAELLLPEIEAVTEEVSINKSRTGYGYHINSQSTTFEKYFEIYNTSEIWVKFDFYFETEYWGHGFSVGSKDNFGVNGAVLSVGTFAKTADCQISANGEIIRLSTTGFSKKMGELSAFKIHRALLHMKSATEGGIIELFLDNGNYVTYTGNINNGLEFANIYLTVGEGYENNPLISNVIISNAPVRLYEDVSTLVYPETFTFDLARDTLGIWRYENYGTASLLTVEGTTVTDLPIEKSKTGSAFYQSYFSRCFNTPPADEVWIKFDVYSADSFEAGNINSTDNESYNGVKAFIKHVFSDGEVYQNLTRYYIFNAKAGNGVGLVNVAPPLNVLTTCILHLKTGIEDGQLDFWIAGEKVIEETGNINNGYTLEKIFLRSIGTSDKTLFSKVVISNAELDFFDDYRKRIDFDLCRNVIVPISFNTDIVRSLPHIINKSMIEHAGDIPTGEGDTLGIESIEVQISEQQLTDKVNYTLSNYDAEILDQFKGQYLDYEYDLRIEEMTKRGVLTTCFSQNNNDEMLYTQLDYKIPANEQWHRTDTQNQEEELPPMAKASKHINKIAGVLNREAVLQFDDFVSTIDVEAGGSTYEDIIRSIFGWTSRIPQMMINCYLRAGKIYVVQRGHEANVIDLTNAEYPAPVIHEELVRTTWGSTPWSKTEVRSRTGTRWKESNMAYPTSSGKSNYNYDNDGLVTFTRTEDGDTITETEYEYETLKNGRKVLSLETTRVYEKQFPANMIDYRQTEHNYLEQGQKHVSVKDEGGDELGSVIGRSIGDDRITPFTAYKYVNSQKVAVGYELERYNYQEERTLNGLSLIDTSFPVYGDDKLEELTNAIKWLNLKTQERIDIDIYNYNHVIDFNDKILFNGNYYYLQNNTVIKNSHIVNKQSLSMVRWH